MVLAESNRTYCREVEKRLGHRTIQMGKVWMRLKRDTHTASGGMRALFPETVTHSAHVTH